MNTNQSNRKESLYKLMYNTRNIFFCLTLFSAFFISSKSSAQSAILSAGNTSKSANYTLSYSIGELSIATYQKTAVTLTQGQQQGTLIITSLNSLKDSGIEVKVYPNPTSNFVMLTIKGDNTDDLEYALSGINGRLLLSEKNVSQQQKISMSRYVSGIYFLSVSNRRNNNIHTFKIIKQ